MYNEEAGAGDILTKIPKGASINMSGRSFIEAAVLLLLTLVVCAAVGVELPNEFELLTVNGAENRLVRKLRGIDAKQLDYIVKLDYPTAAITPAHYEQLKKRGWTQCAGEKGWTSILNKVDKSNPKCVFAQSTYLVKDNNLMFVSSQYRTKPSDKLHCPSKPDNSDQSVVVVIYGHPNRESMKLDELGLSCAK